MLKQLLHLEDLNYYLDKVLDEHPDVDFVGWEYKDGKVLLLYPWVQVFDRVEYIFLWPGAILHLQSVKRSDGTIDYMPLESVRPPKRWWQFWR